MQKENLIPKQISKHLRNGRSLRWSLVVVGVLMLQIPLSLVSDVVEERYQSYLQVLDEISHSWGGEQTLAGPFLLVPYEEKAAIEEKFWENGQEKSRVRWINLDRTAVLLPDTLTLDSVLYPSYRQRGLYRSLVFEQDVDMAGSFLDAETQIKRLVRESNSRQLGEIHWDDAALVMGLTYPKGIMRIDDLVWNVGESRFSPGVLQAAFLNSGFHADIQVQPEGENQFKLSARIRGSYGVRFAPVAKTTRAHLESVWQHPSYIGDVLPNTRTVDAKTGFTADWEVSHLVRSYTQSWAAHEAQDPSQFTFGVRLFEPVTLYTQVTRTTKYGLMFFVLTFMTIMLIELISGHQPNLIQYALIGTTLVMFFLLLIAYSEHLGFAAAYWLASGLVVSSISAYCMAVLSRRVMALIPLAVLSFLYATLYVMLQAEDFALLTGSMLLFVALIVAMYFTRVIKSAGK